MASADTFSLVDVANAVLAVVGECVEERGGRIGMYIFEGEFFDLWQV